MATAQQLAAEALDGLIPYHLRSAATNNATNLKATAGIVGFIYVSNVSAAAVYLKLYDKATAPVPATDTAATVLVQSYLIPSNGATGAGVVLPIPRKGLVFTSGIGFAIVTGSADNDNGSVGAGDVMLNLGYA